MIGVLPAVLAAANGGYFASSWGWAALVFGWLAAIGLSSRSATLGRSWIVPGALAGFAVWTLVSLLWTPSTAGAAAQGERLQVLILGTIAFLMFVRRSDLDRVLPAIIVGAALICAYALAVRLFPDRLGGVDSVAGYRLTRPLGYWNALGIYAAIGCLVATGLLARGRRAARAMAGAVIPIFALTVYFTFSRGAAVALAAGLLVIFALNPNRMSWLLRVLLVGAVTAVAVLAAARETALTTTGAPLASAAGAGHKIAAVLAVVCLLGAFEALVPEEALVLPPQLERILAALVSVAIVVSISVGLYLAGGPRAIVHKFEAPPPVTRGHLNNRLFSFSGSDRGSLWSQAVREYRSHPLLGGGAGSYEAYYLRHRPHPGKVRNAHSLYLETLAELGPVGLALLLVALLTPLVAALRARGHPLVPALAGAYVAFLLHLAVDWDWQLTAVALTGMFCGAAILVARHPEDTQPLAPIVRYGLLAAVLVAIAVGFVSLVSNMSLAQGASAAHEGNWAASVRDARRAETWAPWSSDPWRLLGEAQLGLGDRQAAAASFHRAIAKSPQDWNLWFDLARATLGRDQQAALAEAARLNPLSPEVAELRLELRAEGVINVAPVGAGTGG